MKPFEFRYKAYPNEVAFLFGIIAILLFVFGVAKPILAKDGKFDVLTELYLRSKPSSPLHELKHDTAQAFESRERACCISCRSKRANSVTSIMMI
jgi:hypothetical protein